MAASVSFPNLEGFKIKENLGADSNWIRFLLARNDEQAILEIKKPATIKRGQIEGILPLINFNSANDVHFTGFVLHEGYRNDCKLAYPAESSLVETYKVHKNVVRKETYTDYAMITTKFTFPSCKWIYNILEGKADSDRVLLRDSDPRVGFVLLQENDWDSSDLKDLSYTAFTMRRNLKSIRDLTNTELPLLKNIQRQCTKEIAQRHGLPERKIQARFDYHPIYWHLQVHFYLKKAGEKHQFELETVCNNLEQNTWYYKTIVLKVDCRLPKLGARLPEFKREDELKMKTKQRLDNLKNKKNLRNGNQKNGNQRNGASTPSTSSRH